MNKCTATMPLLLFIRNIQRSYLQKFNSKFNAALELLDKLLAISHSDEIAVNREYYATYLMSAMSTCKDLCKKAETISNYE